MTNVQTQTLLRLCVCCVLAFAILMAFGGEGAWLAKLLAVVGLPYFIIIMFVSFKHAISINRFPLRWAGSAIALAALSGYLVAGIAGLVFSLILSFPAGVIFVIWSSLSPLDAEID